MHDGPYFDPLDFAAHKPTVHVFCPHEGCEHCDDVSETDALIAAERPCPACLRTGLTFVAKAVA